jgi:general secretion pathway protein N
MARLEALRLPRRRIRASRGWRRVRWTLLCIATVGVTVLVSMPATWLAERIAGETQRRVLLADAAARSGTAAPRWRCQRARAARPPRYCRGG